MRELEVDRSRRASRLPRRGVTTLDYVLLMGVVLPMLGFVLWISPRIIRPAFEMIWVLVSWPFM